MAVSIKTVLSSASVGQEIQIQGWAKTARHSKGLSFIELSDGSCFSGLQVVCEEAKLSNYEEILKVNTGASVQVKGLLVESLGKGQKFEVQAGQVDVVGLAGGDYPLQKKRHTFEFLRTLAHLRPRTNTMGSVFRVRNAAAKAIHQFFWDRGFVWLHTPIITASDCEGAGEMFRVTTLDMKNPPKTENGDIDFSQDFFGREAHLTVSGQLEGEIGALALSNVYTFGPTFRAENSNTSRHLAEFWMVEPEMAFCNLDGDATLAEDFLKSVIQSVIRECPDDMAFFNERIEVGILEKLSHIVESPFERMSYSEAVRILQNCGETFEYPVSWGIDLQSEHERYLTEKHVKKPLIVTDYPKDIKAFYMYMNEDEKTVRAMDVLVPGVGEIIGGSQREDRHDVLEARIKAMGLPVENYWWYLDLRRYGSVPHAGFGLGFERLVQFMTGVANIREVIPFPRVPGYAEF